MIITLFDMLFQYQNFGRKFISFTLDCSTIVHSTMGRTYVNFCRYRTLLRILSLEISMSITMNTRYLSYGQIIYKIKYNILYTDCVYIYYKYINFIIYELYVLQPVKAKEETETDKLIGAKLSRYKKKKLQSYNNASCRRSTRHSSIGNKDLNNYKCNNDSAASSFISEDTNMSNTSTCTNNNNISLNAIRKRCRSLSKMSEESTLSNARSSGYDTNTSSDNKSVDNVESSSMFKGFTNTQSDNCGIGIINEMLDDLKSEIDEERRTNERESNSELSSQGNLVKVYKNTIDSCEILAVERDENERSSDNLSNSSKTDDEKLNDIISAENSKLPENVYAKSISASDNVSDISTLTSKSDDEKLSETKTSDSNVNITFNDSLCASPSIDSVSLSEKMTKSELRLNKVEVSSIAKIRSDNSIEERNLRKRTRLQSRYRVEEQHNEESKIEAVKNEKKKKKLEADDKMDEADENNFSVSKLDLHEDVEYDLDDYTNNSDIGYNLRRSKDPKTDECKKHFDKMLSDLGVSDFQLVADTVEGLRDLIGSFSASDSGSNNAVSLMRLIFSFIIFHVIFLIC